MKKLTILLALTLIAVPLLGMAQTPNAPLTKDDYNKAMAILQKDMEFVRTPVQN